jgi:hypothetical protein
LNLPKDLHIHPVQPISGLSKLSDDPLPGQVEPAPPPIIVNGEEEYEEECIENSRIFRRQLQYMDQWKGYDEPRWEPASNIDGLQAIDFFHRERPGKPRL